MSSVATLALFTASIPNVAYFLYGSITPAAVSATTFFSTLMTLFGNLFGSLGFTNPLLAILLIG
jgi:hypothetical protein